MYNNYDAVHCEQYIACTETSVSFNVASNISGNRELPSSSLSLVYAYTQKHTHEQIEQVLTCQMSVSFTVPLNGAGKECKTRLRNFLLLVSVYGNLLVSSAPLSISQQYIDRLIVSPSTQCTHPIGSLPIYIQAQSSLGNGPCAHTTVLLWLINTTTAG